MPILVSCSNGHQLRVKDQYAGKRIKCPTCAEVVQIPESPRSAAPQPKADRTSDDLFSELADSGLTDQALDAPLPARGRRSAQPVQQRSRGSAAWKTPAIIGGAVAAVAALAMVVFLLFGGSSEPTADPRDSMADAGAAAPAQPAAAVQDTEPQQPNLNVQRTVTPPNGSVASMADVPKQPLHLAYLPPDAELIFSVRVADLWNTPLVQKLVQASGPQAALALQAMEAQTGLSLVNIESITAAGPIPEDVPGMAAGFSPLGPALGAAPPPSDQTNEAPTPYLMVVRANQALDAQRLLAMGGGGQQQQHNGATYYLVETGSVMPPAGGGFGPPGGGFGDPGNRGIGGRGAGGFGGPAGPSQGAGQNPGGFGQRVAPGAASSPPAGSPGSTQPALKTAVYFADQQTVLLGTEDEVKAAIDRGGRSPQPRPELERFNGNHHLVFVATTKDGLFDPDPDPDAPEIHPLKTAVEGHVHTFGLSLHATGQVLGQGVLVCDSAENATQLLSALNGGLEELRGWLSGVKGSIPVPLDSVAEEIVGSLAASQDETAVLLAVTLPPPAFDKETLAPLPGLVMGAMFGLGPGALGPEMSGGDETFGQPDAQQADEAVEKVPTGTAAADESGWSLNVAKLQIPDEPASGRINGRKFRLDKASIQNGILHIRQGKEFFADLELIVFLFLDEGETVEGKEFHIAAEGNGFSNPHIHMQWMDQGANIPESKIYTGSDGYAMKLQFGEITDGKVEGKIYVCLPDKAKSFVAGTFSAQIE